MILRLIIIGKIAFLSRRRMHKVTHLNALYIAVYIFCVCVTVNLLHLNG